MFYEKTRKIGEMMDDSETNSTKKPNEQGGLSRRTLCIGIGGAAVMLGLGGLKFIGTQPIIRPPGGQDEDRLLSACMYCQICYEICPKNVIVPAKIEDGILVLRTPTLSFDTNYCNWCEDENNGVPLCAQACPTTALSLPAKATAENTILGIAELNKDFCLAYRLIGCRFCFDACPYEAMELDDYGRPYVLADKCNGCGACESVCVSLQNASITSGARERAIIIRALDENGQMIPGSGNRV